MQNRFSWIIDKKLAGLPRPGLMNSLSEDCLFLQDKKVELLVSLTEEPLDSEVLKQYGITSLHITIRDFHAPSLQQLNQFVAAARETISNGSRVGVHCWAGLGRTGTFLAAYLIAAGQSPDVAIAAIRNQRPGSIETRAQEDVLKSFYQSLC